ncbi:hypothetical protein L1049_002241 [Liquidambar formosana]|uniref:RNA-binding protein NOB1 n=1 Tax=Liquidambar formosana TaxID=63359 RepID=A0AAP0R986_LIQFO
MADSPSPTPIPWSNIVRNRPPQQQHQDPAASTNQVFVSSESTKGITVAIVDANAIIQGGEKLTHSADKFVSVSEVIDEVRDPVSRHTLDILPFTVDTMEPSPEALRKVVNFARATGDLQTLSDVDLKLIALTYTLEAQIHGTKHLRDCPPPVHVVNVKRLPEKDLPGWGSNVPNLEEWEALDEAEDGSNPSSRILPLKDLNLNIIPTDDHLSSKDGVMGPGSDAQAEDEEHVNHSFGKHRRYLPQKKEINIEGKKMVADGIDASMGQYDDNASDWLPAVSRSTHRRFLRRKARREMYEASSEKDGHQDVEKNVDSNVNQDTRCADQLLHERYEETHVVSGISKESEIMERKNDDEDLSSILKEMRLEEDSLKAIQGEKDLSNFCLRLEFDGSTVVEATSENNANTAAEGDVVEIDAENLSQLENLSQTSESVKTSYMDDNSSEQSWMLRSLFESSVACVTSDFAMQNVLLQMGLRLLAPGGMQIRQLHRWILKCHACYTVTAEIGRIFCPKCGNGGTLRKVAVTVGENGIVLADRRPRITLRGTKYSLPLPQGGRDAITKNPILREDQLPQKFLYPKTKKVNKQGEDIFTSDHIFCHHTDKKAPLKPPVRKALAVFSGKRNPNDNHYARSTLR